MSDRASRVMPPMKHTLALPERLFWIIRPGTVRGWMLGYVVDERGATLAASEDLDALEAAARLVSGQARWLRGDDPPPEYLGDWQDKTIEQLLEGAHT